MSEFNITLELETIKFQEVSTLTSAMQTIQAVRLLSIIYLFPLYNSLTTYKNEAQTFTPRT